jgi:hypothetical protein
MRAHLLFAARAAAKSWASGSFPIEWRCVKITYAISLREFRTLHPAARPNSGRTAFVVMMGMICLALIVPGASIVMEQVNSGGQPPAAALVSITLGIVLAAVACALNRRAQLRARVRQEDALLAAYDRIHCRDSRTVEATSESLSLNCKCGLVSRPWTELTGFTETPSFLIPLTRNESFPIPKSAFASEGALTEFRRLILDKLHTGRPFTAAPIDFAHTRADFWRAKWLHIRKGGGWRRVTKIGFVLAAFAYAVAFIISGARAGQIPAWLVPIAVGAFIFFLTRTVRLKQHYYGPLRFYFSEEGFHVEDPASQSRRRWSELAGYLEDRHVYLLYLNPLLYRVVPKRALGHRAEDFGRLVQAALPQFDYRRRLPVADAARI